MIFGKLKHYIFEIFFAIITINALSTLTIFFISHSGAEKLERVTTDGYVIKKGLTALLRLESAMEDLNGPGNDIFESKNIELEETRLKNYMENFKNESSGFRDLLDTYPELKIWNRINQKFSAIKNYGEVVYTGSLAIFKNFSKNNLAEASKNMAQMDRAYGEMRTTLKEIRYEFRNVDDEYGTEQVALAQNQNTKTIIILIINFTLSLALFLVGFFVLRKSQSDEKVLFFYKLALDKTAIVAETDRFGTITFANDKFTAISGYDKSELIGQDHRIVNSDFHSKAFFSELWKTIGAGKVWRGEIRNKKKDGDLYWVDTTIIPTVDKTGSISRFVSIRFDITQRKKFESLLTVQQQELDQFFDLSQDLLGIAYTDGSLKKVSKSWERLLGLSTNEILSTNFFDLVHPRDVPTSQEQANLLSQGHPIASFTCRCRKKNGEYVPISWTATPSKDGMIYAIGRDISEMTKVNEKLQEAARVKSRFLANMSHEIRTPLNGIMGMSTLLSEESLSPNGRRNLGIMRSSGETLLTLINDILDFSKIEAGKLTLENISFCLEDTVNELVSLLGFKAKEKRLNVLVDIDKSLPKYITADVTRLRQVISNLLGNAIKFTQQGSVTISVSLKKAVGEKYLIRFDIKDTGFGITDDDQKTLFKSFSQVDASTTRKFGGTGLGLAICKGICEAMGGEIWVQSKVDEGSTFSFTFIAELAQSSSVQSNLSSTLDPEMGKRHPLKILVADDHSTNQLLAKTYLEKLGYESDVVGNGLEVLRALELKKYDVIFMDGHMPEMDGYETSRKILSDYGKEKAPWIIALTASSTREDQKKCYDCGMNDFVSKPFTISSLAQALLSVRIPEAQEKVPDVFDADKILKHFAGDEEIMRRFIRSFLSTLPESIKKIETATATNNSRDLYISAHTLKGNASNFFHLELEKLLADLEDMGHSNHFAGAAEKVIKVKEFLETLSSNLNSFLSERKAA